MSPHFWAYVHVIRGSASSRNYAGSLVRLCICVSCVGLYITSVPLLCRCLPLSLCSVIDSDKLPSELLILWSESLMLSLRAGLTCWQHHHPPSEVTAAQTYKHACIFTVCTHTVCARTHGRHQLMWQTLLPASQAWVADDLQPPTYRHKRMDIHAAILPLFICTPDTHEWLYVGDSHGQGMFGAS